MREITRHDLWDWHVDEQWLVSVCLLAETCALARRRSRTLPMLYDLLLPLRPANAVAVPELALDSASRPLGLLATRSAASTTRSATSGRRRRMNERMGARPWLAHTRREHARMLLQRDAEGDRGRAVELLARARALYRELGMDGDLVRVEELRAQATAGSNSDRLT